jgi:hypothetical protein
LCEVELALGLLVSGESTERCSFVRPDTTLNVEFDAIQKLRI